MRSSLLAAWAGGAGRLGTAITGETRKDPDARTGQRRLIPCSPIIHLLLSHPAKQRKSLSYRRTNRPYEGDVAGDRYTSIRIGALARSSEPLTMSRFASSSSLSSLARPLSKSIRSIPRPRAQRSTSTLSSSTQRSNRHLHYAGIVSLHTPSASTHR